jgi:adenine-specific DNA-methyltransferase
LRPCREESVDFDTTKNLFIEGDNLEALKLLQETYLGKVKVIYIDPPYNTGNDFIYRDNFSENATSYLEKSNQLDSSRNILVSNPETNGRFHSDWLTMVYQRLRLSKNLLSDDGVIFISIDDGESHNLRKICEEIFGESNFVADISWQKRYTRSNNTVDFTTVVEHILVYAKSNDFIVNLLPRTEEADARYTNPDNDPRGVWKGASFLNPATPQERPNLCYPITNPNTKKTTLPTSNAWRRSKAEFERLFSENRLYWGTGGDTPIPTVKMFLSEARGLTPVNFWNYEYAGNTDQGTSDLEKLFEAKVFDNPKPVLLIQRILEHSTRGESDIVLDFFSGSATTAQAVLTLNSIDNGRRRFILIQIPDSTESKPEAMQMGLKTIADIGKERIRRFGNQLKNRNELGAQEADVGFRVFKVDASTFESVYYSPSDVKQETLLPHIDNIREGRTSEDLLFQVLLDWGIDLALPILRETLLGKEIFTVDETALITCFDSGVDEEFAKSLAKRNPLRVVFRDTGFPSDDIKINVMQIFKTLSPDTELKVI